MLDSDHQEHKIINYYYIEGAMRKASPIALDNFFMVGGKSMKSLIKSVSFVVILCSGDSCGVPKPQPVGT